MAIGMNVRFGGGRLDRLITGIATANLFGMWLGVHRGAGMMVCCRVFMMLSTGAGRIAMMARLVVAMLPFMVVHLAFAATVLVASTGCH